MVFRSDVLLSLHQGMQDLLRMVRSEYRESLLKVFGELLALREEKNFELIVRSRLTTWISGYRSKGNDLAAEWTPHCQEVLTKFMPQLSLSEELDARHAIDSLSAPWQGESFEHFLRRRFLWEVLEGASKELRPSHELVDDELVDRVFQINRKKKFTPKELTEVANEYFDSEVYARAVEATVSEGGGIWMLEYGRGIYSLNFSIALEVETNSFSLRVTLTAHPTG